MSHLLEVNSVHEDIKPSSRMLMYIMQRLRIETKRYITLKVTDIYIIIPTYYLDNEKKLDSGLACFTHAMLNGVSGVHETWPGV